MAKDELSDSLEAGQGPSEQGPGQPQPPGESGQKSPPQDLIATFAKSDSPQSTPRSDARVGPQAQDSGQQEDEVPAEWEPGMEFLDYKVEEELGRGSFGTVHKVHHEGWNVDMAVKSALVHVPEEEIVREAEVWMELGLHPNIVSCYFVRTLGGIPRIFVEYVDGGTLHEWLYGKTECSDDGTETVVEKPRELTRARRLGIAIEICRGMQHAHGFEWTDRNGTKQVGLVHRDLKPLNILMTDDSVPRITDFGLVGFGPATAKGQAQRAAPAGQLDATLVKSVRDEGGLVGTPAYAAPEQWGGRGPIGKAADVYAFGVILYELFCGRRPFELPEELQHALPQLKQAEYERLHCEETPPAPTSLDANIDPELSALMLQCLAKNPKDRGDGEDRFSELGQKLKAIYKRLEGESYDDLHPEPKAAELLADSLNNRATSYLEIGQPTRAEELWAKALEGNPHHPESTYGLAVTRWRHGKQTDFDTLRQLQAVVAASGDDWITHYLLGLVHLERGDTDAALSTLARAREMAPGEPRVSDALDLARIDGHSIRAIRKSRISHAYSRPPALDRDAQIAVWGYNDCSVRLWDLGTGRCLHALIGHKASVNCVAVNSGATMAVSGDAEQELRVWDLSAGKCTNTLKGHAGGVLALVLSQDSRSALSGGADRRVLLWDLKAGQCLQFLAGHRDSVVSVAMDSEGKRAFSVDKSGTAIEWDLVTGRSVSARELCVADDESGTFIESGALDPDGRLAMLVYHTVHETHHGYTCRTWNFSTSTLLRTVAGVRSVALSPNGRFGLCTDESGAVRIVDVLTGQCFRTIQDQPRKFDHKMFVADGTVAACWSGVTCILWNTPLAVLPKPHTPLVRPTSSGTLGGCDRVFRECLDRAGTALARYDSSAALAAIRDARSLAGYERHPALLDVCGRLSLRARRTRVRAAYLRSTTTIESYRIHKGYFVGDRAVVVASPVPRSKMGQPRGSLWDARTGECICVIRRDDDRSSAVTEGPPGPGPVSPWAMSVDWHGGTARLTERSTGRCLRVLADHSGRVRSAVMGPDHRWALSADEDGMIRVWDLSTGSCVWCVETSSKPVRSIVSVALSSDGCRALIGSHPWRMIGDTTGSVWDIRAGTCLFSLPDRPCQRKPLALSRDGRWALSGDPAGVVNIWSVAARGCVHTIRTPLGRLVSVALSDDARYVLIAGEAGRLNLWELDWDVEIPEAGEWDEGAQPYLDIFLAIHTPYADRLPKDHEPSEQEIRLALTRRGKPVWNEEDFKGLLYMLGCAGYGWIQPDHVQKKLEEMTAKWQRPPPLFWEAGGEQKAPEAIRGPNMKMPASKEPDTSIEHPKPDRLPLKPQERLIRPDRKQLEAKGDSREQVQNLPRFPRNAPCPCGSGKKYKECCGSAGARPVSGAGQPVAGLGAPRERTLRKPVDQEHIQEVSKKARAMRRILLMPDGPAKRAALAKVLAGEAVARRASARSSRQSDGTVKSKDAAERTRCVCGAHNPPEIAFCTSCGKRLPGAASRTCPHCRNTVPTNARFCVHCGKGIDVQRPL